MIKEMRKIAKQMQDGNAVNQIKQLCTHIEDISDAQDEMTLALITIYRNQLAIAKHLNVVLPEPLVKMEVENE